MTPPARSGWVDCLRLCRALALITLGATMHMHQSGLVPAVSPRVAPLRLASSPVEAAERGIVVNRALVFAPLSGRSDEHKRPHPQLHPVRVTGLLARAHSTVPAASPVAIAKSQPSPTADLAAVVSPSPEPITLSQPDAATNAGGNTLSPDDLTRVAVSSAAGVRRSTEEELVRQLIDRYTGALERLDVGAAQAAWPTVNGKALKRAFGQLASQRLTFQSCGITISGSTANARCRGSATYQPRVGSGPVQLASREWTFDFSKQDTDWRIINTFVR